MITNKFVKVCVCLYMYIMKLNTHGLYYYPFLTFPSNSILLLVIQCARDLSKTNNLWRFASDYYRISVFSSISLFLFHIYLI